MVSDYRINIGKLAQIVLFVLILPTSAFIIADFTFGTWPILTLVVFLLCTPFAAVLFNRTVMREMDQMIQVVAPEPPAEEDDEQAGESTAAERGEDEWASTDTESRTRAESTAVATL